MSGSGTLRRRHEREVRLRHAKRNRPAPWIVTTAEMPQLFAYPELEPPKLPPSMAVRQWLQKAFQQTVVRSNKRGMRGQ